MAIAANVQIPARNPAVAPQLVVVVGVAKNAARFADDIRENTAVKPNILALLPFFMSSSVSLLSVIQAVPKTFGLYQIPPIAKEDRAATTTAGQLIKAGFIVFKV